MNCDYRGEVIGSKAMSEFLSPKLFDQISQKQGNQRRWIVKTIKTNLSLQISLCGCELRTYRYNFIYPFLKKVGFDLKTFVCTTIFYTLGCIEKLFIRDYSGLYDIYIEVKSQRPVLMYWTKEKK